MHNPFSPNMLRICFQVMNRKACLVLLASDGSLAKARRISLLTTEFLQCLTQVPLLQTLRFTFYVLLPSHVSRFTPHVSCLTFSVLLPFHVLSVQSFISSTFQQFNRLTIQRYPGHDSSPRCNRLHRAGIRSRTEKASSRLCPAITQNPRLHAVRSFV